MNARRVAAAAGVIHSSQVKGKQTAAGVAADLEAACLLQSPESAAELAALRDELRTANEALSEAAETLRENAARVAELEALKPAPIQECRKCGAGYTYGEPCSNCLFRERMAVEVQARSLEDPHDSPLYSPRKIPHDLEWPEPDGQR